ncbi:hypothetical protein JST97_14120 [bacterium]|nr:hypothetical protein [bacterium]
MASKANRPLDLLCLLLAGLLCLIPCAYYFECTSPGAVFRTWYAIGDLPLMASYCRAYADGDCVPLVPHFVSRLNAPYTANWADFPTSEELIWVYGGLLARLTDSLTAYNLAILSSHIAAGLALYLCARAQGSQRAPSLLAAFIYSTSRFLFVRDAAHIVLSFCWHVPIYWLVTRWLWEGRNFSRKGWFGLIFVCWVAGWQNPYLWYGWMVMLVPCWLHPLLLKQWKRAVPALLLTLASLGSLVLANLDTILSWLIRGRSAQTFSRTINELQLYGLRLPELLLPCEHHLKPFDQWAQVHYYMGMHNTAFEMESHYLGLLGVAALFHLAWAGLSRLVRLQPVPFAAGMTLWLFMVSIVGGLNMCAGVLGLLLFRCSCRFSVIVLAGVLLHLAEWMSQRGTLSGKRWLWLFLLIPLSCLDTMPPRPPGKDFLRDMVANERALVDHLEKTLPPKAMVFQWPVMEFPEAQKINDLQSYEQLYAYVLSKDLRFSYGDCRGRSESEWQRYLSDADKDALMKQLESYGFEAFVLYRTAFKSDVLNQWDSWKRQPDYRSPWNDLWVYRLHPVAHPEKPPLMPGASYGPSFYREERDNRMRWNWAFGDSWLDILVPKPCLYRYRFGISAMGSPTRFRLWLDGQDLGEVEAPAEYAVYREVTIDLSKLKPGLHRVRIQPQCSLPNMLENGTRLSFQLVNPTFELLEAQKP